MVKVVEFTTGRFTNRKFPFVCSGSVNQFFIDVHFCMTSKGQMMLDIQFWVHFPCVIKVSPAKNAFSQTSISNHSYPYS